MWKSIISLIPNLLGIGKQALENRAERKNLEAKHDFAIIKARTDADVDRILSNTDSDNAIDLQTARDKTKTWKDEILSYLILMPLIIATAVPFIQAYESSDFSNLNNFVAQSYQNLELMPYWWPYALFAVMIDILGFRSFARILVNSYINKKFPRKDLHRPLKNK